MPENENELDPGAPTQMFQAFVDRAEPEASGSRGTQVALAALAGLVILLALAFFVLRG